MICRRLKASKKMDTDLKGTYPSRIVVLELRDNKNTPFTTHREIFPYDSCNNGKPYVAYGDYYQTKEEAERSFFKRCSGNLVPPDNSFTPETEWVNI